MSIASTSMVIWIGAALHAAVTPPPPQSSAQPQRLNCAAFMAASTTAASAEFCQGETIAAQAEALPVLARERRGLLEQAASHYQRASTLSTQTDARVAAILALTVLYDDRHLASPSDLELVIREWLAVQPDRQAPYYRLAELYERQGSIELAEDTLVSVRRRWPGEEEPYRRLTQFFARLGNATQQQNRVAAEVMRPPAQPDANGVYRVGGGLAPPRREGVPQYPAEARAAEIRGVVIAEILIDPAGTVADAKILRSIPMLDEAALTAVRKWRYEPTLVNGQPVPVRMTVTVNFAP